MKERRGCLERVDCWLLGSIDCELQVMGIEDRQTLRARNRAVTDTRSSSMEQRGNVKGGEKRQKLSGGDVKVGSGRRAAQVRFSYPCLYFIVISYCLVILVTMKMFGGCRITILMKQK